MSEYTCWCGIVAFPLNPDKDVRQVSGKTVRKFSLNVEGYEHPVSIDLFPDFESVDLQKGDLVIVGGKVGFWEKQNEQGDTIRRYQMQPFSLKKLDGVVQSQPPGVKQAGGATPGVKRKTF